MDGIDRTAPLHPAENPASPSSFRNESARSSGSAASSFAASGNPEEIFHLSVNGGPDECGRWTDEKHDIFLSLLEASFVRKPMTTDPRFQDHAKVKTNMSQKLCTKKCSASNQLSVAQDSRWHEINELANHDIQVLGFEEGSGQNFVEEGKEEKIIREMYAIDHQVKMKIIPL